MINLAVQVSSSFKIHFVSVLGKQISHLELPLCLIYIMSDPIQHECGIAFIRLKKPLEFYQEKYGTSLYGLKRLQLLMAKQLNRGQDGAGIGVIKLNPKYGNRYIARKRSVSRNSVADMFNEIRLRFEFRQMFPVLL